MVVPHQLEEGKSASKDAGPQREVDLVVVPHRLEEGKSASEDAGPQRGVYLGVVPHRLEEGKSASEDAVLRRGVDCDVSHWLGRRTNHPYKGVEIFMRFKAVRGSCPQRGQYLLAVKLQQIAQVLSTLIHYPSGNSDSYINAAARLFPLFALSINSVIFNSYKGEDNIC